MCETGVFVLQEHRIQYSASYPNHPFPDASHVRSMWGVELPCATVSVKMVDNVGRVLVWLCHAKLHACCDEIGAPV